MRKQYDFSDSKPNPYVQKLKHQNIDREAPASGVLTATRSVSLDDMEVAIQRRGGKL